MPRRRKTDQSASPRPPKRPPCVRCRQHGSGLSASPVGTLCDPCWQALTQQMHKLHPNRFNQIKHLYGLDRLAFATAYYRSAGLCEICEDDIIDSFHIDHDHDTGEVRGLLCGPCNRGIGLLRDSKRNFGRAVRYLSDSYQGQ